MRQRLLRWGLGAGVLLVAYFAGSVAYVRWAMTKRAECSMPCRDLGLEYATPPVKKEGVPDAYASLPTFRPACQPLDLKLELHRSQARRGTRYALWYRLTLTNFSCYRFPNLSTVEFGETWEGGHVLPGLGPNGHLVLRVWDPDGNEIPRENFKAESPATTLYRRDFEAFALDWATMDPVTGSVDLDPGRSITSARSMLWPRVLEREIDWKIGEAVWRYNPRPLPKDAETPPEGFAILDMFVFERPGTYTIQAVYENDVHAEPILPYENRIPVVLVIPSYLLELIGVNPYPDRTLLRGRKYLMRAESETLSFTVAP